MKRYLLFPELSPAQRREALAKLHQLAAAKVKYDGTLMPYAWAERIAPLLRYNMTRGGGIWDVSPAAHESRALGIFRMPVLAMPQLYHMEAQ